jgi:hypothetical protein
MAPTVEYLLSKSEALSSNASPTKKKKITELEHSSLFHFIPYSFGTRICPLGVFSTEGHRMVIQSAFFYFFVLLSVEQLGKF